MILGFTESFRANFYCRICKYSRTEMEIECCQNDEKLRNITNYDNDFKLSNVSETATPHPCIWNDIPSFHVTENFSVDIAHDIFEGVALFDFTEIFYQFVFIDKLFSIDTLNSRLKYFEYGEHIKNKPPLISHESLKKRKINMSCSKMKNLILFTGLIFGNLIPSNNNYWRIYILLRKILTIVLSTNVSEQKSNLLKEYISEHHMLYKNIFGLPLKPKHHILTHYPYVMLKSGPLIYLSSLRYESKHRQSKLSANISSRVNITKTFAIKHQLQLSNRIMSSKGFQTTIDLKKDTLVDINSIIPYFQEISKRNVNLHNFQKVYVTKRIKIHETIYDVGNVVVIEYLTDSPIFGKLKHTS